MSIVKNCISIGVERMHMGMMISTEGYKNREYYNEVIEEVRISC